MTSCPYCAAPRTGDETHWDLRYDTKVKVVSYQCGTTLDIVKEEANYKGSDFVRRCAPPKGTDELRDLN